MTTVVVKDKYVEALAAFGDLETAIDLALQRYTIEQVTAKVAQLRQRVTEYETKYGMDYPTFEQRVATDESFVDQIEATTSKTWELDLADWEFCHLGIKDWTLKLEKILLT